MEEDQNQKKQNEFNNQTSNILINQSGRLENMSLDIAKMKDSNTNLLAGLMFVGIFFGFIGLGGGLIFLILNQRARNKVKRFMGLHKQERQF